MTIISANDIESALDSFDRRTTALMLREIRQVSLGQLNTPILPPDTTILERGIIIGWLAGMAHGMMAPSQCFPTSQEVQMINGETARQQK